MRLILSFLVLFSCSILSDVAYSEVRFRDESNSLRDALKLRRASLAQYPPQSTSFFRDIGHIVFQKTNEEFDSAVLKPAEEIHQLFVMAGNKYADLPLYPFIRKGDSGSSIIIITVLTKNEKNKILVGASSSESVRQEIFKMYKSAIMRAIEHILEYESNASYERAYNLDFQRVKKNFDLEREIQDVAKKQDAITGGTFAQDENRSMYQFTKKWHDYVKRCNRPRLKALSAIRESYFAGAYTTLPKLVSVYQVLINAAFVADREWDVSKWALKNLGIDEQRINNCLRF